MLRDHLILQTLKDSCIIETLTDQPILIFPPPKRMLMDSPRTELKEIDENLQLHAILSQWILTARAKDILFHLLAVVKVSTVSIQMLPPIDILCPVDRLTRTLLQSFHLTVGRVLKVIILVPLLIARLYRAHLTIPKPICITTLLQNHLTRSYHEILINGILQIIARALNILARVRQIIDQIPHIIARILTIEDAQHPDLRLPLVYRTILVMMSGIASIRDIIRGTVMVIAIVMTAICIRKVIDRDIRLNMMADAVMKVPARDFMNVDLGLRKGMKVEFHRHRLEIRKVVILLQ